jgi:hypothetical protein
MAVCHDFDFSHVAAGAVVTFHGPHYTFLEKPITLLGCTRSLKAVCANVKQL